MQSLLQPTAADYICQGSDYTVYCVR